MRQQDSQTQSAPVCSRPDPNLSGITLIELTPEAQLKDYLEAMKLAKEEASQHLEDFMLMSWYDRDRDFESPQHATESDEECAVPGYVEYGINHGATLKIDIEKGRFIFFFTPVEW
jgi:Domain of unknown function (DUF5619)